MKVLNVSIERGGGLYDVLTPQNVSIVCSVERLGDKPVFKQELIFFLFLRIGTAVQTFHLF